MDKAQSNNAPKIVSNAFFAIAAICVVAEIFEFRQWLLIFKPMLIPTLMTLYMLQSSQRSWIYIFSMLFTLASNIFLLYNTFEYLLYATIAVILYRILAIILVAKYIDKFLLLPFIIATLPFLFIFSCLLNLTMTVESPSFIPSVINGILLSILAGIALSCYVMNDNKANSWLAISTLLFIVLAFLFMIQKYYLANIAFQPMSAVVFTFAHYTFYRFVIESESPSDSNRVSLDRN